MLVLIFMIIMIIGVALTVFLLLKKITGRKNETVDIKEETAQRFVNVKDIRDKFLYTRDGKIISYIQINPFDINLLSKREKITMTKNLTAELTSERKIFKFLAISRPIDITPLLSEYQNILSQTSNQKQKELLRHEMLSISNFALSGEVVERQFYIMLWEEYEEGMERDLLKRTMDMVSKFESAGIKASILNESKIIRLCNLVNNPAYTNLEASSYDTSMPFLINMI